MPRGERGERIEVDADEVERLDLVLGERRTWSSRSRRARMPAWIAGWSVLTRPPSISGAPVTSSTRVTGSPCSSRNVAVPPDETSSNPSSCEAAREVVDALLVVDGDQGAGHSSLTTRGSSRCSTAWMRSSSVSRGSTGTAPARARARCRALRRRSARSRRSGRRRPRARRRSRARRGTPAGATGGRSRSARGSGARNGSVRRCM